MCTYYQISANAKTTMWNAQTRQLTRKEDEEVRFYLNFFQQIYIHTQNDSACIILTLNELFN
jgi:hypothetical protein